METIKINFLRELEGQEVWTNAFGDRICVGIKDEKVISAGEILKVSEKQVQEIWDNHIESEFGSKEQIAKDLQEEFSNAY